MRASSESADRNDLTSSMDLVTRLAAMVLLDNVVEMFNLPHKVGTSRPALILTSSAHGQVFLAAQALLGPLESVISPATNFKYAV
jgi:hypothetical protein